jgi:hypothetical protein
MGEAAGIAMACDILYSRGKAVAWFNSILAPLDLSPSAFFGKFLQWLHGAYHVEISESILSDEDIHTIQRDFISYLYKERPISKFLPVIMDQIDFHWHYAAALLAVPPEPPCDDELEAMDLLDKPVTLAPSARLAAFNYDINDILNAGELDLKNFCRHFSPRRSFAVIYPFTGEVMTESLSETHFNLLFRLDGISTPRQIASTLNFPTEEAVDLLKFCAAEGIILC